MVQSDKSNINTKELGIVRSRLKELIALKEREEGRVITNTEIAEATGLQLNAVARWMKPTEIKRIESRVVKELCAFLKVDIGDLLFIDHDTRAPRK